MTKQLSTSQSHFLTIPYRHLFILLNTPQQNYCISQVAIVDTYMSSLYFKVATIAKFKHRCILARSHSHFIHTIVYSPPHHAVHCTYTKRSPSSHHQSAVHQNDYYYYLPLLCKLRKRRLCTEEKDTNTSVYSSII